MGIYILNVVPKDIAYIPTKVGRALSEYIGFPAEILLIRM